MPSIAGSAGGRSDRIQLDSEDTVGGDDDGDVRHRGALDRPDPARHRPLAARPLGTTASGCLLQATHPMRSPEARAATHSAGGCSAAERTVRASKLGRKGTGAV